MVSSGQSHLQNKKQDQTNTIQVEIGGFFFGGGWGGGWF